HCKSINDSHGRAVGDDALRLFATTMRANLRDSDIIARFGGEEFVAMLPGTITDAAIAAERVRLAFEAAGRALGEHHLGATVSVGDRKSTRLNSSHVAISYAVFCLKKKK